MSTKLLATHDLIISQSMKMCNGLMPNIKWSVVAINYLATLIPGNLC